MTTNTPLLGAPLTRPTSISQIRSEFDAFLYASVDENGDQSPLSVISALARLDFDPWQEAAKLSRMSRDKAAWRLAALIETLPNDPSAHTNCRVTATRLIALLPRHIEIVVPSREATWPAGMPANIRMIMILVLLNVLFMALFFGRQYTGAAVPPAGQVSPAQSAEIDNVKPATPSRALASHNLQEQ